MTALGAHALPGSSPPDDVRDLFVAAQASLLDVASEQPVSDDRTT